MSPEFLAQLAQLALVPIAGLLWRISTQIATLVATVKAQDERIDRIERQCEARRC